MLIENDLYIQLEEYKWKVKEVGFLEVVIELEEIMIEEKKIKEVLDQLTPKEVKNIQKFLGLANYYQQFSHGILKPLYFIFIFILFIYFL